MDELTNQDNDPFTTEGRYASSTRIAEQTIFKKPLGVLREKISPFTMRVITDTASGESKFGTGTIITGLRKFHEYRPFFYDKNHQYWLWNNDVWSYEIVDETELLHSICKTLDWTKWVMMYKSQFSEALRIIGRACVPKEPPLTWVQTGRFVYDIEERTYFPARQDYWFCNVTPYEPSDDRATPIIDGLLAGWVGEDKVVLIKEIMAYCLYRDYPLQYLFCFIGSGSNGKGQLINMMERFIGSNNTHATTLEYLTGSSFGTYGIYKKLFCAISETDHKTLNNTRILKQLSGEDPIMVQQKYQLAFGYHNHAKIVMATNSLPPTEDTTNGFFRRWVIVEFPNDFTGGRSVIDTIPPEEYRALTAQCLDILPELLARGKFSDGLNTSDRKKRYLSASNPLPEFIETFCETGNHEDFIPKSEFYSFYCAYLDGRGRIILNRRRVDEGMQNDGYIYEKINRVPPAGLEKYAIGEDRYYNGWVWLGMRWKKTIENLGLEYCREIGKRHKIGTNHPKTSVININNIYSGEKCAVCWNKTEYCPKENATCHKDFFYGSASISLTLCSICSNCYRNIKEYIVKPIEELSECVVTKSQADIRTELVTLLNANPSGLFLADLVGTYGALDVDVEPIIKDLIAKGIAWESPAGTIRPMCPDEETVGSQEPQDKNK